MAIMLNGVPVVEPEDFGDAPDPTYPTLRVHDGASHAIDPGFHLGRSVDYESNGQPNSDATGDDIAGLDDENGVRFRRPLVPGRPGRVRVIASADGLLDAWISMSAACPPIPPTG